MKDSKHQFLRTTGRREFFSAVARGATISLATPSFLARAGPATGADSPWQMRLSTSSIHYMKLSIEQACERIAKLGFEAIDIWSAHAGCPHLDDVAKRFGPDGLKELLAKNKLKLFAFSVYAGGYPRYAELLGKVGGGVAIQGSGKPAKAEEISARMRDFLESLKPQIELAAKNNTRLAIENHGGALLNTLDSFKAFVELNQSPHLGVALAPFHVQATKASVEEAVAICGKQLFFFYAWQRGKGLEQLPGHGPTDFSPWITALAKAGYSGYVNPFMHGDIEPDVMSAALEKSRDYLKKCHVQALG